MLLNEVYDYNTFNTSSVRNIYSPEVRTAVELMTDKLAADMGKDPIDFRHRVRPRRAHEGGARAAEEGEPVGPDAARRDWRRASAVHNEYKGFVRLRGGDRHAARRP